MIHHLTPDFLLDRLARGERSGRLDGACVFVDISGFTPLTLALMEHGTEGAEVLAGVLAAVFTPLIDTVYAHGGFIAGFAGDAFKAVFPAANDDAAVAASAVAHAVTAAWAMGEHLRHAAAQTTRFGTFAFSGKVCVAAGAVHWEVWQADGPLAADAQQAAYVFGGPALDAAMQLDPLAARGEVVLTAAVAAHMAQPLQTAAREGGLLLTRLDAPLPASEDAGHTPAGDPALAAHFFPSALLNSTVQGEFRRVTTAFVNLTGTLPAAARDDFAATLFRLLAQYDGFLGRVGRIGGKDDGHTFLLFWGAPTGSERDVDRALGFLLDMQAASPVALRAGVTTHLAYAGFVGAPRREEYTCYGSYVNLAARQVIAAAAHEIWVDAATATAARDFTTVAHGTHTFKGMDAARPIFLVTGRRARTQARAYDGHMVGRTRELARLDAAVAPIFRRSFGGMVIVRGEAGMGKS
ncbi:MAG: hypothetical protein KDD83_15320, partial [Caldilineaceae bacterium]|nr:hypothetical protein [Caldilineaceae bacterium]